RRPHVTEPQWRFARAHPSDLPLARLALVVRVRLGHHPSAFARFVTWRLRGSGNGLDTGRGRGTEPRPLISERLRVATFSTSTFRTHRPIANGNLAPQKTTPRRRTGPDPHGCETVGSGRQARWWPASWG